MSPTFKDDLRKAIRLAITRMKREGTVGMSRANLMMVVRIPPGGPVGTNCKWVFRETFNEVIDATPSIKAFVTD